MKPSLKKLAVFLAALAVVCAGIFAYMSSSPMKDESVIYAVQKGSTLRKTANDLAAKKIIRNADLFVALSYLTGTNAIRSGSYRIFSDDSAFRVLRKIQTGEVITGRVTIPEGFSLQQIADAMQESGICNSSEFMKYSKDQAFLARIGIKSTSAEGYLFPETYVIALESDPRDVMLVMKKKTDAVLAQAGWKEKKDFTTHQMLTLASIIEKEAKIKDEQKTVSSVFHNRMKVKMSLQSCATVLYALNKTIPHLSLKDLEVESPYNTYKHNGLTPTPIASPGKGAILAAIKPADTDYLFFVARNDGSHYFSRDYSTHLKAQNFYINGQSNGFKDDQR